MYEVRYYPLVDMDSSGTEKVPMFGGPIPEEDTQRHDLWLMETVPHFYRLRSKAPLSSTCDNDWNVRCPLCGHAMKTISAPGSAHSRSLYHCPKCSGQGEENP